MDIRETIIWEIGVCGGSESRIIDRTISSCHTNRLGVEKAIVWLKENGYIDNISIDKMTDEEKSYYKSDLCPIYRVLKKYNEQGYRDQLSKSKKEEDKLDTKSKFDLYFNKMEKKTKKLNPFAKLGYIIKSDDKTIEIDQTNNQQTYIIKLDQLSNLFYDQYDNCIYYRYDNSDYILQQDCFWNLITIRNYKV